MRALSSLAVCVLAGLAAAGTARGEWHVWTLARTERVLRDAPAGSGTAVRVAAARNEWESFQILLRADAPVAGITVEPADLRGPDAALLPARLARLYRQHQLELTVPTYRNEQFKPGWYPDALIPFDHPLTRQPLPKARLAAVPFDLPANETHGFWVDLYVPADARPGVYRGTYRVAAKDQKAVEVPVELTVWDFALPPVPTLQTDFGSPADRLRGYYRARAKAGKEPEPSDWKAVADQCAELVARHGLNATPPGELLRPVAQPDGSFRIPPEQVAALREFVDRYHVNAVQVPHPSSAVKDPEREQAKLHAWLKSFDEAAAALARPHVLFYTYLRDEPNKEEEYRYVQTWGKAIRAAKSAVKVLVVEQTWTQDPKWGDLYGAVDIWCPLFSLFEPESTAQRQALGELVWTYTALCQEKPTPWWHIDFPLLHYRVPAWTAWRYRLRGLLYWGGLAHWTQVEDPWTDPKTYGDRDQNPKLNYNGEGSLTYPGRAVGYDGIAPSLRLKALRDGIEDYEYMAILERAGQADAAQQLILPLTPSWFQWEKDPAAYERTRAALAELIVKTKK